MATRTIGDAVLRAIRSFSQQYRIRAPLQRRGGSTLQSMTSGLHRNHVKAAIRPYAKPTASVTFGHRYKECLVFEKPFIGRWKMGGQLRMVMLWVDTFGASTPDYEIVSSVWHRIKRKGKYRYL